MGSNIEDSVLEKSTNSCQIGSQGGFQDLNIKSNFQSEDSGSNIADKGSKKADQVLEKPKNHVSYVKMNGFLNFLNDRCISDSETKGSSNLWIYG